jgi:hypothetical protein
MSLLNMGQKDEQMRNKDCRRLPHMAGTKVWLQETTGRKAYLKLLGKHLDCTILVGPQFYLHLIAEKVIRWKRRPFVRIRGEPTERGGAGNVQSVPLRGS